MRCWGPRSPRTLEHGCILQQRGTRSTSGRGGAGSCARPLGLDCNNSPCVISIGQGTEKEQCAFLWTRAKLICITPPTTSMCPSRLASKFQRGEHTMCQFSMLLTGLQRLGQCACPQRVTQPALMPQKALSHGRTHSGCRCAPGQWPSPDAEGTRCPTLSSPSRINSSV